MEKNTHQSIEKVLRILLAFTPNNDEKTATEIASHLGIHVSTSVRLLGALATHGFVYKDPRTKRYSLGRSAFEVGQAVYRSAQGRIVVVAQTYIDQLRDELGEHIGLEVLSGHRTVITYRASGSQAISVEFDIGDSLPIHAVAGGKAILAFSSPSFVEAILREGLPPLTPNTITDPQVFRDRLAEYRETGVAYDFGEVDLDYHFVAAPIFGIDGRPVAAVVTGGWANRIESHFSEKVIMAVKKTAAQISSRLQS
jgi:IclR family transcriptional regulator, KDG regulon repressor